MRAPGTHFYQPRSNLKRHNQMKLHFPRLSACIGAIILCAAGSATWASTIRVHYDTGYGNRITVRGSAAPLSWTAGANATWTTGRDVLGGPGRTSADLLVSVG
jgi:hypothetical protein